MTVPNYPNYHAAVIIGWVGIALDVVGSIVGATAAILVLRQSNS